MCEPQWQPIETAPEFKVVLIWIQSLAFVTTAFRDGDIWRSDRDCVKIHSKPTHWLPLPTPPKD